MSQPLRNLLDKEAVLTKRLTYNQVNEYLSKDIRDELRIPLITQIQFHVYDYIYLMEDDEK